MRLKQTLYVSLYIEMEAGMMVVPYVCKSSANIGRRSEISLQSRQLEYLVIVVEPKNLTMKLKVTNPLAEGTKAVTMTNNILLKYVER